MKNLRDVLKQAQDTCGGSMKEWTVLAPQNDPFRNDTPTGHRDGEWLAGQLDRLGVDRLHFRGIHYKLCGVMGDAPAVKPDGTTYLNSKEDWLWLQAGPGKSSRWLGYVDFDRIVDERNTAPKMVVRDIREPESYITVGVEVDLPDPEDFDLEVHARHFTGRQEYRLALFGEKSSLAQVLAPISERYSTDLLLPTGELSDTMIHTMAAAAYDDGRPTVCLYISDCDPSGHQMAISLSRKLQALQYSLYPGLDVQVRRIALTPDQVREYGLPSSVLKETEKRAGAWVAAMGVEQTEVDAVPGELLTDIVEAAISPYFDKTLERRVKRARDNWRAEAQLRLNAAIDPDLRSRVHAEAREKLEAMRAELDALNEALAVDTTGIDLPGMVIPDPEYDEAEHGMPLFDSRESYVEQTRRLRAVKAYEDGE